MAAPLDGGHANQLGTLTRFHRENRKIAASRPDAPRRSIVDVAASWRRKGEQHACPGQPFMRARPDCTCSLTANPGLISPVMTFAGGLHASGNCQNSHVQNLSSRGT
ncbi:hypothetical protein ABIB38_000798 [Massilia sp. UYP11]|uniref:hypothetical protein n=1 Tax=Massilia sp. UYP11 TaxID=1756385 RepID=UPI003D1FA899